jgi:hypothetical protein
MEDEEHAYGDAHFQEELDSLKVSVTRSTSLLEQVLRNASGEGLSNKPTTIVQNQAATQPEEIIGEQTQDPQYNPAFMQSTTSTPAPTIIDTFANEAHKTRSLDNIDQDKMAALETSVRALEGVDYVLAFHTYKTRPQSKFYNSNYNPITEWCSSLD